MERWKQIMELNSQQFSDRVREILLAQPLNPFVRMEFARGQESWSMKDQDSMKIMEEKVEPLKSKAPQWLVERMKKLSQLPPPTLEEVETSFRASEEYRRGAEQDLYVSPVNV